MSSEIPNNKNISNILKFISYFESTGEEFYKLDSKYLMNPYVYSKEVNDFIKALYKENIIFSFGWPNWQNEAGKYYRDPELIKTADIKTLRKLLTLYVRKERFRSGHLANMIKSGHILNILKRLKIIEESLKRNKDL
jgi:O-acetyl-ADP-ribose deacetylase